MRDRNYGSPELKLFFDLIKKLRNSLSREPFYSEINVITSLTEQEFVCLLLRFEDEKSIKITHREVAEILKVSKSRPSQIISKALRKMRRPNIRNALIRFLSHE